MGNPSRRPPLAFRQVGAFEYADGVEMPTVVGVFVHADEHDKFEACGFDELDYYKHGVEGHQCGVWSQWVGWLAQSMGTTPGGPRDDETDRPGCGGVPWRPPAVHNIGVGAYPRAGGGGERKRALSRPLFCERAPRNACRLVGIGKSPCRS